MNETNSHRAYDHLRRKLISGEFSPGSRIRYGPVGKELGISATPVREAIGQLANEGFVELVPQLGAVVRKVSSDELIEIYELREALESYAAASAATRVSETRLKEISDQLDVMVGLAARVRKSKSSTASKRVVQQFEKADLAFHMLIIESTGNQLMVRTVGNQQLLTGIFSMERHGYDETVMARTCKDHATILKALKSGDPDAAREAMATHIRNGLDTSLAENTQKPSRWWERV
jgi:DNA-binding GntR family transcriptional regulator